MRLPSPKKLATFAAVVLTGAMFAHIASGLEYKALAQDIFGPPSHETASHTDLAR